jgi:DNA transformation protein
MKSYWQLPERLYDDEDELAQWARRAHDAARRATMRTGRAVGKAAAPAIRRRARR